MATLARARESAQKRADDLGEPIWIVYDPTVAEDPRQSHAYYTADAVDLETFFSGLTQDDVVEAIHPGRAR